MPDSPSSKNVSVPRDAETDADPALRKDRTPAPGWDNPPDEYYTDKEKPLPADSAAGEKLHRNPPAAKGETGTGSGGDAARPGKEGVSGKPLPPRGQM